MSTHPNPRSFDPAMLLRPLLVIVCLALVSLPAAAAGLPRSAPEAQGVSSPALLDLVETLHNRIKEMHSLIVVRHGQVVAEGWWTPYAAERNHVLFSLSKSFTATAVGLAVAEGKLSIDDEVLKFFPDAAPAKPSANLRAMRVRDLLTMSSGHEEEPPRSPAEMSPKSFLAQTVPHKPGTHFKYNTPATFMQSAIVQKVTGETLLDYLRPRLFEPLGIEHPVWDTNFEGISLGGYGLRVRTEDIAKFGQLYLQKGQWQGRQLLPAAWVDLATSRQMSNGSNPQSDWEQGYGFQFWRCRHGAFRGDGAFGQFCLVLPAQDAVVAITSGGRDLQGVLNVLWEKLLPALNAGSLPADAAGEARLRERLSRLQILPAGGAASSALGAKVLGRSYKLPANPAKWESIALRPGDTANEIALVLRREGTEYRLPCGNQKWSGRGRGPYEGGPLASTNEEPMAGTYGWENEDTCAIRLCMFETPFVLNLRLKFAGDQVTIEAESNVGFGQTKRPPLIGRAI